jgi:hypothetical protein
VLLDRRAEAVDRGRHRLLAGQFLAPQGRRVWEFFADGTRIRAASVLCVVRTTLHRLSEGARNSTNGESLPL